MVTTGVINGSGAQNTMPTAKNTAKRDAAEKRVVLDLTEDQLLTLTETLREAIMQSEDDGRGPNPTGNALEAILRQIRHTA